MKTNISIIGSGFSSVSAACYLAKAGYNVRVFEKNDQLGGRARQYVQDEFKFDMGPTWYWMPGVFERFFEDFNRNLSDYYKLEQLDPGYRVFFGKKNHLDISGSFKKVLEMFENEEAGSAEVLNTYLSKAGTNYHTAIDQLVYRPGLSPLELITKDTIFEVKQFVRTIRGHLEKKFKSQKLRQILEFPVLFLGAKPSDTPLFYNFMNHADLRLGTWYPIGGMRSVMEGMLRLAKEQGVRFETNADVSKINCSGKRVQSIVVNGTSIDTDLLLSGADYYHTEQLLESKYRNYKETYWDKKVLAPSALMFYVAFDEPIKNVLHHTLFFDESFDEHAKSIYDQPSWPEKPLFYASFPGKTDRSICPEGKEAGIFLIPLAPDIADNDVIRNHYFDIIIDRLEYLSGQSLKSKILFKKSYCVNDFKSDYNSFRGNAYGLANTLTQTAFLRPKLINKQLNNLFYTGQLTVPGPGVPPAIISGKLVSELIVKSNQTILTTSSYENSI